MFAHELGVYRKRLLEGGMAWSAVRRHVRELQDHHRDLREQALASGLSMEAAETKAREQIGDLEQLATQMLATSRHSLLHRFPVTFNVLCPLILLVACYVVSIGTLVLLIESLRAGADSQVMLPAWLLDFMPALRLFLMHVLPLLIVLPLVWMAKRARIPARYWLSGVFFLCVLGSGITTWMTLPDPAAGRQGSISVQFAYTWLPDPVAVRQDALSAQFAYGLWHWNNLRLTLNLLLAVGFAGFLSKRQEPALE